MGALKITKSDFWALGKANYALSVSDIKQA